MDLPFPASDARPRPRLGFRLLHHDRRRRVSVAHRMWPSHEGLAPHSHEDWSTQVLCVKLLLLLQNSEARMIHRCSLMFSVRRVPQRSGVGTKTMPSDTSPPSKYYIFCSSHLIVFIGKPEQTLTLVFVKTKQEADS